ncbi:EGF-like module-containing mucin-like hormone receptor-like 1, partial [Stegodyphus mimosarum]
MLASAISLNGFELGINNITSRIFEIHETVDFLTSWCLPEHGGEQKEYWNSDFTLILNENASFRDGNEIIGIYINKTNKYYPKGQFVVDILYKGLQFDQKLVNVSGMAIVCDKKAKLNESCARVLLEKHEYSISKNGSFLIHNSSLSESMIDDTVYEYAENDSVYVCLRSPATKEGDESYYLDMDIVQAYVSFVLSWVSVVAMGIVMLTYCVYSSLRNLPGCNTMNLTFSLLAMQITFLFGQRNNVIGDACKVVAHILHYEILCCFMWMNVMAYDLYRTFGNKTLLNNIRSKGKYVPRYMAYAYGTPVIAIVITSLLDNFLSESNFSPHYGRNNVCWITNKNAAIVFFALPLALIMCINSCFYMLTILSIRNVKHVLYLSDEKSRQRGKSDVFLYMRMAVVIGLTWALAFAAAYVERERLTGRILRYLFIIFNTLQGVFIFIVFVCNRRVFKLYRDSLTEMMTKISKNSASGKASQTLFRIANVMKRSVSSDTVVSTVSNSSNNSNDSTLKVIKETE